MLRRLIVTFALAVVATQCVAAPPSVRSGQKQVAREFRGVWVATVENIDWPSKRGLPVEKQKQEFIAILDKCVDLNINAVIFQIRTQADALYDSKFEPWSEYLTGEMGKPPEPYYDPLQFAVEEAHKRGLQLHVWFNPYRVRVPSAKGKAAPNHASIAHPESVRKYGRYQWFDPGHPESEKIFISVLTDVVKRYDIDGVHIDDYFYPYQERGKDGNIIPFPDDDTYQMAVAAGVKLERDDWRRQNVNHLIKRMYDEVKAIKPWVLVGISPFGIWRPGHPQGVVGFDQYATLYADAKKWEEEGWLDYLTPQIYWQVQSKGQPYAKLLAWWAEHNVKHRHLWPGNFTSKVSADAKKTEEAGDKKKNNPQTWTADDILQQIAATRATPGATGNVHFSMKAIMQNYGGIADKLKNGPYAQPALVPETPWLGHDTPAKPEVTAKRVDGGVSVEMKTPGGKMPWQWLVRIATPKGLKTAILTGAKSEQIVPLGRDVDATSIRVSGISRLGKEGPVVRVNVAKQD